MSAAAEQTSGGSFDQIRQALGIVVAGVRQKRFGPAEQEALEQAAQLARFGDHRQYDETQAQNLFYAIKAVARDASVKVRLESSDDRSEVGAVEGFEFEAIRRRVEKSLTDTLKVVDEVEDRLRRQAETRRLADRAEEEAVATAMRSDFFFAATLELLLWKESEVAAEMIARPRDLTETALMMHRDRVREVAEGLEDLRRCVKVAAGRIRGPLALEHLPLLASGIVAAACRLRNVRCEHDRQRHTVIVGPYKPRLKVVG
jgi:hypothetical protein